MLHKFPGGVAEIFSGPKGQLYGSYAAAIFRLLPPQAAGGEGDGLQADAPAPGHTAWTEKVVYALSDYSDGVGHAEVNSTLSPTETPKGVLLDVTNVGGVVSDGGVIFSLTPTSLDGNATPSNGRVLYEFTVYSGGGAVSGMTTVPNPDGTLSDVGITSVGGQFGYGTVYHVTP